MKSTMKKSIHSILYQIILFSSSLSAGQHDSSESTWQSSFDKFHHAMEVEAIKMGVELIFLGAQWTYQNYKNKKKDAEIHATKTAFTTCLEEAYKSPNSVKMSFGLPTHCNNHASRYEMHVGAAEINKFRRNQADREKYTNEMINTQKSLYQCRAQYPEPKIAFFDQCKQEKKYFVFLENKLKEINN